MSNVMANETIEGDINIIKGKHRERERVRTPRAHMLFKWCTLFLSGTRTINDNECHVLAHKLRAKHTSCADIVLCTGGRLGA